MVMLEEFLSMQVVRVSYGFAKDACDTGQFLLRSSSHCVSIVKSGCLSKPKCTGTRSSRERLSIAEGVENSAG